MQRRQFFSSSLAAAAALEAQAQGQGTSGREYYELRRYHMQSGPTTKAANKYFEEALIPALNRLGMKTVGTFDLYLDPRLRRFIF